MHVAIPPRPCTPILKIRKLIHETITHIKLIYGYNLCHCISDYRESIKEFAYSRGLFEVRNWRLLGKDGRIRKILSRDRQSPDHESNQATPEYKYRPLPLHHTAL